MAEKSGFFNSVDGDRKYKADFFAEYFASFIGNGVFPNPSTNLQIMANGGMSLILKAGKAWINGYYYNNDSDLILNVDNADGVLNRIDRVVLKFDTVTRNITAKIKKGSFATNPIAPTLQRDANAYELALAEIYIGKGIISISQSSITDLRQDTTKCGIVHGTVDQVDTTTLFNQYQTWLNEKKTTYDSDMVTWTTQKKAQYDTWYNATLAAEQSQIDNMESQFETDFNSWFAAIKNTLDGDAIGNLTNKINAIPKVYKGGVNPTDPASIDVWIKELANKNVQLTQRNSDNSAWEDVFPLTKAANVSTSAGGSVEDQFLQLQTIQTAGGTATAITLTGVTLSEGFTKTFIVNANNSGAATTINGKPLYKPNTTTAPTLTKGKAVTVWFSVASNAFFSKASATGQTTESKVLAGETFSTENDTDLVGTMPNYAGSTISTVGESTVITAIDTFVGSGTSMFGTISHKLKAAGYMTGETIVKQNVQGLNPAAVKAGHPIGNSSLGIVGTYTADATAIAADILSGKTVYVNGSKLTGTIASKAAATITPSTADQVIAAAQYLAGAQTVKGDPNLLAQNILAGIDLFGIVGTVNLASLGGTNYATGSISAPATVPLSFTPNLVVLWQHSNNWFINYKGTCFLKLNSSISSNTQLTLGTNSFTYTTSYPCTYHAFII